MRRHDDRAVAIVDGFHAHEATPFAVAQISDGIAGLLSRIPYHGLRCALLGDNDGALQHGVAQLKRIGASLLNIHGQHDGQQLLDEEQHLVYLDRFGRVENELARTVRAMT